MEYSEIKKRAEEKNGTWVYNGERAKMTHIVDGVNDPVACCNQELPYGASWLGTGNQAERDKAQRLPPCIKCVGTMVLRGWFK